VVSAAFGDVEVAGAADGVDDRGADGGQVDRSVAGAAGGVVFGEGHVADVVAGFHGPVFAGQAGEVVAGGLGGGQAGDGVDVLAGGLSGPGVVSAAGDLDGLVGVGQVQILDVGGLQGAGFVAGRGRSRGRWRRWGPGPRAGP
jgi:hypothetical protein